MTTVGVTESIIEQAALAWLESLSGLSSRGFLEYLAAGLTGTRCLEQAGVKWHGIPLAPRNSIHCRSGHLADSAGCGSHIAADYETRNLITGELRVSNFKQMKGALA